MEAEQVRRLRSFNRTVSQRIGTLKDHFLDRDRPLGEARLLYEIGRAGADVRDLRARLELDSGYVSRSSVSGWCRRNRRRTTAAFVG